MKAVFEDPGRERALRLEAESWVGTPFLPNCCAKGIGVSCQKLASAVYAAAWKNIEVPEVSMRHSRFSRESLLVPWVDGRQEFQRLEIESCFASGRIVNLQAGDLLGFTIGNVVHHCGVHLGAQDFIHAMYGLGAGVNNLLDATWRSRLAAAWRPIE